jgi:hypothetical protein
MKLFLMALLFAGPLYAQTPWIHVEVDEAGEEDSHVKVNLPLSLVRVALEAAPQKVVSEGRVRLGEGGVEVEDLRRMWRALRDSGEAELASVESSDENVRIRREGDVVKVTVDRRGDGADVSVELPVDVIDALLSGEGNALNVLAAVDELGGRRGEIVRVADGETRVRVWIDERD